VWTEDYAIESGRSRGDRDL